MCTSIILKQEPVALEAHIKPISLRCPDFTWWLKMTRPIHGVLEGCYTKQASLPPFALSYYSAMAYVIDNSDMLSLTTFRPHNNTPFGIAREHNIVNNLLTS